MPAVDVLTVETQVIEQLQGQTFPSLLDAFTADMEAKGALLGGASGSRKLFGFTVFASALRTAETYYLSPGSSSAVVRYSPNLPRDTQRRNVKSSSGGEEWE